MFCNHKKPNLDPPQRLPSDVKRLVSNGLLDKLELLFLLMTMWLIGGLTSVEAITLVGGIFGVDILTVFCSRVMLVFRFVIQLN